MPDDEPKRPEVKVDADGSSTVQVNHVDRQNKDTFGTTIIDADKYESGPYKGSPLWVVAKSSAPRFEAAVKEIRDLGGIATSSGGVRDLHTAVGEGQSATSFHYTGLAIDLYIYSGMVSPTKDPFVIVTDGEFGSWRVFGRTTKEVQPTKLTAWKIKFASSPEGKKIKNPVKLAEADVDGKFFDVTAVFAKHGCSPIRAKKSFIGEGPDSGVREYKEAEWWHFQDDTTLDVGKTTFGSLLEQLYKKSQLEGTPPYLHKDAVWNGAIFK